MISLNPIDYVVWFLNLPAIMKFVFGLFVFWFSCFFYYWNKNQLPDLDKYVED